MNNAIEEKIKQIKKIRQQKSELEKQIYYKKLGIFNYSSSEKKIASRQMVVSQDIYPLLKEKKARISEQTVKLGQIDRKLAITSKKREILKLNKNRTEIVKKIAELEKVIRSIRTDQTDTLPDIAKKKEVFQTELAGLEEDYKEIVREYEDLMDSFFDKFPVRELTKNMDDRIPIMLFPVKIETKFHEKDDKTWELWIRVYPDKIAVITHENELTEDEISRGKRYWKRIHQAGMNEDDKKKAWSVLLDSYGAPRAAWIARQTKPTNWDTRIPLDGDPDFEFPEFKNIKPDSWTLEPRSKIMPDRFVFIGANGESFTELGTGRQIPDPLICGPDPLEAKRSIYQDSGDIILGNRFDWLTDFNRAVESGMGIKIPLEWKQVEKGFDKLYVLGLKWSVEKSDGQKIIADLVNDHHYSQTGFTFLRQGSATNNTDASNSDYSENDIFSSMSYYTETKGPLISDETDPLKITDGQRLAEFLGISSETFQNISNADMLENAEALAMNRALYPGTLGYFLDTLMEPVFNDLQIEKIRNFYTEEVTGRGPLAAIRIGNQPYGILPTSDFKNYKLDPKSNRFLSRMYEILRYFYNDWKNILSKLSHIGIDEDPAKLMLDVLGLHPNSVEHAQRVGFSMDYLINLEDFCHGGKYYDDYMTGIYSIFFFKEWAKSFGYDPKEDGEPKKTPHYLKIIYQHYSCMLEEKNLIDGNPVSEEEKIKPYKDDKNYIHWLIENQSIDLLEKQNFGEEIQTPRFLLYLMLRHALLLELYDNTGLFLTANGIEMPRYKRAKDFLNIKSMTDPTRWELMKANISPVSTDKSPATDHLCVADYLLNNTDIVFNGNGINHLKEVMEAFQLLAELPTARLERAFVEHIDTLSYRLDSWITALITKRLKTSRYPSNNHGKEMPEGIYFGSFGWLENVKYTQPREFIYDTDLPLKLRKGDNSKVFFDRGNGGFVHTPSLNHANAAALLRNGYLTHATPDEKETLAINLSSARIRNAMDLIEGIRNGQCLEELLGYQFERGMHDKSSEDPELNLNQYILDFRMKFPLKKQPIPQEGTGESEEVVEDFWVVNGLELTETETDFPFGIESLSDVSDAVKNAILELIEGLKDSIDAIKDVLTSESIYGLSLGNFDKTGAVLKTLSQSEIPAEIEGIRSQRGNEITFTNRVMIHLETNLDLGDPVNNPWEISPFSPRATLEPALNKWLGEILGKPENIRCTIQHQTGEDTYSDAVEVNLKSLSVHPVDFVYILGNELQSGATELELRLGYYYRREHHITDEIILKINFDEKRTDDSDVYTFADIFPLAVYLKKLINDSRSLNAEDLRSPSKDILIDENNPRGLDFDELIARANDIRSSFENAITHFRSAKDNFHGTPSVVTADALREQLRTLSDFGFSHAFPLSHFDLNNSSIISLEEQAEIANRRVAEILQLFDANMALADAEAVPEVREEYMVKSIQSITGEVFKVLPLFSYHDASEIDQAYRNKDVLIDFVTNDLGIPHPVEEWIQGVSRVRSKVDNLQKIRTLAELVGPNDIAFSALQLPYKENDNWLAVELPEPAEGQEREILHDTLSIVSGLPTGFNAFSLQQGLFIDDWVEVIPEKESVTGITMNYNQPNAEPAQTILLAVTPDETKYWEWSDLINILDDTLLRAKLRAVEPDLIDYYSPLLPAIISEFSTSNTNISLDYSIVSDRLGQETLLNHF